MSTFHLKIMAADRTFFDGEVESLVIPQHEGEMGILAHHESMAVSVVDGTAHYKTPDGKTYYVVTGIGIASILFNEVNLLVAYAEKPEEIDLKRAEEAMERAKERIRQKKSIEEYRLSQAAIARAMARISAVHRS